MNKIFTAVLRSPRTASLSDSVARTYAFKSDLKIKWVRPEKIPCYKPEKSGDLEGAPPLDLTQPLLEFKKSKELENANEHVKKLFSLEFNPKKYSNRVYFNNLMEKVKRHDYDVGSVEVTIARWTGIIRAWQECMERFPRNKRLKVKLKELIDKRKKKLKYLRRWDYKRFEWLLETLNILYKAPPDQFHWITRRESLTKLTDKYCTDVRQTKLDAYRLQLEAEQPAFLEEKVRTLEFIREEQKSCGVEITITQEEIDQVKREIAVLNEQRSKQED